MEAGLPNNFTSRRIGRRALLSGGAGLAGVAGLAASPAFARVAETRPRQKILLMSIDGLRPRDVLTTGDAAALPFLHRMMNGGTYASRVIGVTPTSTYPSHMTLLTGVLPARHGIVANMTFDPFYRNQDGWYWYYSDVTAPSLWSGARERGLKTLNLAWPVSVGAPVDLNLPQIWRSGTADDAKLAEALATPGLHRRIRALTGAPYFAEVGTDGIVENERRAAVAARLIAAERPDFTTLYFGDFDHEQHAHGPDSAKARSALSRIDAAAGKVATAALLADPDTLIVVVSDHGFRRVSQDVNLYRPLEEAKLIERNAQGAVSAWKAVPWLMGGSAAIVLSDRGDVALRMRTAAVLRERMARPGSGIARILDRTHLDRLGAVPIADFLVVLADGYKTAWYSTAPYLAPSDDKGMHGYLAEDPAMAASLFVMGRGIPARRDLGTVRMTAIAGSLAVRLGVTLGAEVDRTILF